jgi:hypothetical protein
MTWLTRINDIPLEIITGDEKVYNPIFRNASDVTPVNEAVFEFVDKKGGLVRRGEIGVKQFNVEFNFTGPLANETVAEFEASTEDKRAWRIKHPYYDEIIVHPSTLNFDRSNINNIIFTTTLYETISDLLPGETINVQEDVLESVEVLSDAAVENATQTNQTITQRLIDRYLSAAISEEDYQNVLTNGNEAINNINDASVFMRSTTNLLRTPARYYAGVSTRINVLKESFIELKNVFFSNRNYYENSGASLISAICEASIITGSEIAIDQNQEDLPSDYRTRSDTINSINQIISITSEYFDLLNQIQSDGYLPNYTLIRALFNTITKTIAQLFIFSQNALQQRNYTLPQDMSLVTLHHRLYGNIETLQEFAEYNNLTIEELLIIPKDREVIYFV